MKKRAKDALAYIGIVCALCGLLQASFFFIGGDGGFYRALLAFLTGGARDLRPDGWFTAVSGSIQALLLDMQLSLIIGAAVFFGPGRRVRPTAAFDPLLRLLKPLALHGKPWMPRHYPTSMAIAVTVEEAWSRGLFLWAVPALLPIGSVGLYVSWFAGCALWALAHMEYAQARHPVCVVPHFFSGIVFSTVFLRYGMAFAVAVHFLHDYALYKATGRAPK